MNAFIDYSNIRNKYITTTLSLAEIVKQDGNNYCLSNIYKICARENWKRLREDFQLRAARESSAKAAREVALSSAERARKIQNTANKLLEKLDRAIDDADLSALLLSGNGVKQLSSALRDLKDVSRIKSEEDLREQEKRIALLDKQIAAEDENTRDINVTVVGVSSEDVEAFSK